ncbi:DUF2470 domain-containing protein [Actinomadura madurae]|uniref:DUF2470 domain-containing protein n=1 Tax=Actinomadura madurae TaxID=1993 RepID=UPI002026A093|nr:DUF2470 domain-containing protein [Actinomadura madurae]MCP9953764.1 DUF2470 domain-containing protein [Actinomadura madurae]MCP9970519.1 DUF2470 domain-containing protein [Actinomadura madurae]MCP9982992.1 DUF2470 domain-containing protein [Actinomadura madurae]MCQ0005453.1 DUF2470 domain-containing protein [Actinomadura madurae]MCQ0019232.1 DUF2470 domain-containing protein [Actinomadura madurae]
MRRAETRQVTEGPTAAERARTLAYGMADGVLVAPGVPYAPVPAHTTDRDGRPLLLVPAASPIVAALRAEPEDVPATLRISDVAPVTFPDRVRGRAWLHGWLTEVPDGELRAAALRLSHAHPRPELLDLGAERDGVREWTILALEVAQVEIDDAWGSATLEPEEYADAAPDPFVAVEAGILTHLDAAHRDELPRLLPESVPGGPVRPLALDRYGMWLRCSASPPDGPSSFDVRLAFPSPVSDLHGLRCVYRRLFARATP